MGSLRSLRKRDATSQPLPKMGTNHFVQSQGVLNSLRYLVYEVSGQEAVDLIKKFKTAYPQLFEVE
jgi:hypothetical protein